MEKLTIQKYVNYLKLTNEFQFDLYELLSTLIYARCVNPCSKHRTFHDVLPNLYHSVNYSYDQLLDGLAFLGTNYEKFIEIFTVQTASNYGLDTSTSYFDCTNDCNQLPIGMKMYPGNESEKPVFRDVIDGLKMKNNIEGKTIHVADKGLNCAQNIAFSKKNGDGYLFSKSVKTLPETEKTWVILKQDYQDVKDKHGKVLYRYKSSVDKFPYTVEFNGQYQTVMLTEKRLVTYNPTIAAKKRYEINKVVEKARALTLSQAKKNDHGEAGKYVNFVDKEGKKAKTSINQKAIEKDLLLAGYNLLVTSEIEMTVSDIYIILTITYGG